MKIVLKLVPAFCLFAASPGAYADTCGSTTVLSAIIASSEKRELTIDTDVLSKTPEWVPGNGDPPLAISNAVNVALPWAKNHYKHFENAQISRITLSNSACFGTNKHWYYIFEFEPVYEGSRMFNGGNWLAVLMDGTIVETKTVKTEP